MRGLWLHATSSLAVASAVLMTAAVKAYASPNATVVRTTIANTVGYHTAYAICPRGEDATGGGVALSGGSTSGNYQIVIDSGPVNSTDTFIGTATGAVPIGWYGTGLVAPAGTDYAAAVCG